MDTRYLGKDLAFDTDGDLVVSPTGDVATVSGIDCLMQNVQERLRTLPTDLWKHPEFGCETNLLLGASDTALNRALAMRAIRITLENEPRIDSKTITIKQEEFTSEAKVFSIGFRVKGANREQKLVVGFGLDLKEKE